MSHQPYQPHQPHPIDLLRDAAWQLTGTAPGAFDAPGELADLDWVDVRMPDTVAGALRSAGLPVPDSEQVDGTDWWMRTTVTGSGPHLLSFDGLATVADVWLGGRHVLQSSSMWRSHHLEVHLDGRTELVVRCAAPLAQLGHRGRVPRPRWKSTLVPEQRWRWLRTTALGRIPSWTGAVAPAGPWRPARLVPVDRPVLAQHRLAARLVEGRGAVTVELDVRGPVTDVRVAVGAAATRLARDPDGRWRGTVDAGIVRPWWPRGYGEQVRYPVAVELDGQRQALAPIGFRAVHARTDDGGFALEVNGVPVFARGAVWQPPDPVSFAAPPDEVRATLRSLADAGHTLVRVPGTGTYETDAFYVACDELGLLVWQDCMLTTLDPPDTHAFLAELAAEVGELADRLAARACVAVVCGGAETEQQPALLGLPAPDLPALTDTVPGVLAERLPDVAYVTSTPSGGGLPVHTGSGVAQYFGVGAYLRPLRDVRAAGVRFAAEALAFSVPPEQHAVLAAFGSSRPAGHDPRWKAAVPRDPGASWDFEDVRDHYVAEVFGVDPRLVRMSDPDRYLDLGRAAVCVAMTEVLSWWRRPRSGCAGGVVLAARDLATGAGWGLLDSAGRPKAPWYALRPVLAPTAVLVGDDGGDGVGVAVVHDGPDALHATVQLRTHGPRGEQREEVEHAVTVPAHGAVELSLDALLGRFTDANHYYRFGPRSRDVLHARLLHADGRELARTTALLGEHLRPAAAVRASLRHVDGSWRLAVAAATTVQWLAIDCATHEISDSWFHLAPGESRVVTLRGPAQAPVATVRALNVVEQGVPVEADER